MGTTTTLASYVGFATECWVVTGRPGSQLIEAEQFLKLCLLVYGKQWRITCYRSAS